MVELIDAETTNLISYFLEISSPFVMLVITLFILWGLQIIITQRAYLKYIFPEIRKHKITYWAIGWVAIASHEILGHMIVGASTGARIEDVVVTPTGGHVTSTQEVSLLGQFSLIMQSFAPCFSPPIFMVLLFYLLFPNNLLLPDQFTSILDTNIQNVITIASTITNLWNPYSWIFIYALIVTSLTAGASTEDVRVAVVRSIERPLVPVFLFIILLALTLIFANLGYDALPFLFWLITLSFAMVMLGIVIATFIAFYLKNTESLDLSRKIIAFLSYAITYLAISYSNYPYHMAFGISIFIGTLILLILRLTSPRVQRTRIVFMADKGTS
ncbi:hypothetical protein HY570_00940 [Candidatus Micrarchaeota archaeon]|nr:hypothetical protein [Candidatus Micrarchaeota archaeon]